MGRTKQSSTQEVDTGMKIEYNKVYNFDVKASFGDLPQETVNKKFRDGRAASHFLEMQLEVWFPELTFVDAKGHDHVDENGKKYDQKCFTKGGLGFAPSHMGGKGRVFVKEEAHDHARDVTYICCDIVDFPNVKVVFKRGRQLIEQYPQCKVKFAQREEFFTVDNG